MPQIWFGILANDGSDIVDIRINRVPLQPTVPVYVYTEAEHEAVLEAKWKARQRPKAAKPAKQSKSTGFSSGVQKQFEAAFPSTLNIPTIKQT